MCGRNVSIQVPVDLVNKSITLAVDEAVRAEVECQLGTNEAFRAHVQNLINAEVAAQAPGNPRIKEVIKEVQEHLDRYPSIANNIGLQNAVGVAIFDWLKTHP